MNARAKLICQWITGLFFVLAGANHFIHPKPYLAMMPSYLPAHAALVQISGVAEMLGGFGVMLAPTRKLAAWGLILLLLAVFPANLDVALHGWPGENIPAWVLWLRLPFQPLFIWWVYYIYLRRERSLS